MKASIPVFAICLLATAVLAPAQKKPPSPPKPQEQRLTLNGFRTEGGVVNVLAGEARAVGQKKIAQRLKSKHQFENGDEIQVGENSYLEVLLNPGSFLRLAANTRVRLIDLSPDNLKLEIIDGSMIVESDEAPLEMFERSSAKQDPNDVRISFDSGHQGIDVMTPQGDFMIARGGLYRCDIDGDGRASLKVIKGLAVIPGNLLSDGMSTTLGDRVPTIENIDSSRHDQFDTWSRQRAMVSVGTNKALRDTPWGAQLRKNDMSYLDIKYEERSIRMKEALTISAIGGLVAFSEPGAEYQAGEAGWQPLTADVELKAGDRLRTNGTARVEIHLYPECNLLVNSNTEIVYGARPDEGVAIKLIEGSVMLVSSLKRKLGVLTSLIAPVGEIEISEGGVYRLNVKSARAAELVVHHGSASIRGQAIAEGQRAVMMGSIEIGPTRWMDIDPFELWGRKRSHMVMYAQELEALNRKMDTSKHGSAVVPQSVHRVIDSGLWYLFPETDAYTFVPPYRDRRSPYGPKYEFWFRSDN